MLEKAVWRVVNQMEKEKLIEEVNRDEYEYALLILAEHTITIGTILILGMLLKRLAPTVLFLSFFFLLRRRTGGYHADEFWKCYFMTVITYLGVIRAAMLLSEKPAVMYAILLPSVFIIGVIGAVNHPNIAMNETEFRKTKQAARRIVLMETMFIIACAVLQRNQLCVSYMSLAVILCSATLCLAKVLKQEVEAK